MMTRWYVAPNLAGAIQPSRAIRLLWLFVLFGLQSAGIGHAQFDGPPRSFTYGSVDQVAYTPDGRLLVVSGSDGIHVFDGTTLEDAAHLIWSSTPLGHGTTGLAFASDARLLAAPYTDTTAVVWDLETFTVVAVIEGHTEKVSALAFSDDGRLLASGDSRGLMRVWSTDTWALLAERTNENVRALAFYGTDQLISSNGYRSIRLWTLPAFDRGFDFAHEENIHYLVVLPDGRRLLSGAADGTVRLWDLLSGEALAVMNHSGGTRYTGALSLAPDGRHVYFSGSSSQYNGHYLWSLDPPTELEAFTSSDRGALGFSDDGRQLLVWSYREEGDYTLVRYLDLASRQYVDSLRVDRVGHLAYNRGSMQLAMVDNNTGLLFGYDLRDRSMVRRTAVYMGSVDDIAFSPGGEWVAAAFWSSIHIWDVASKKLLLTLRTGGESVDGVAFSDDCRDVYVAQTGGLVRRPLEDPETALPILAGGISSFAFAPSVGKAAVGRRDGRGNSTRYWAAVVDLANAQEQHFEGHPAALGALALSANGALLAASGEWRDPASIWLWRVADKVLLHRLPIQVGGYVLAFSHSGDLLAATDWAGGVKLWRIDPIALVDSVATQHFFSAALEFSPDGRWLAYGESGKRPLRLLDLDSSRRGAAHSVHASIGPNAIAFSPTGDRVAVGGRGGHVMLWDAEDAVAHVDASPCSGVDLGGDDGADTVVVGPLAAAATLGIAMAAGRPNPVSVNTVVPFLLPSAATVQVEVYNLAGQRVQMIADGLYTAGAHEVVWDGRDRQGRQVASGVYLVRMRAGSVVRYGKLLIVR